MSELSDKLVQINAGLRAAIVSERQQVTAKFDELKAEIQALKDQLAAMSDQPLIDAVNDTETIIPEVENIFNEPA